MEVQTTCGLFTKLKASKAGNFTLVIANENSPGGQCGGGGLIMETGVSRYKSISPSNRESPLPSAFPCLMLHLICNRISEVRCHTQIKRRVQSCVRLSRHQGPRPKIPLKEVRRSSSELFFPFLMWPSISLKRLHFLHLAANTKK